MTHTAAAAIALTTGLGATLITAVASLWFARGRQPQPHPARHTEPRHVWASGIVEGTAQPIELQFEVPGTILEVLVQPHDWVKPTTPLAHLNVDALRLERSIAHAQLELATANKKRLVNGTSPEALVTMEARITAAVHQQQYHSSRLIRSEEINAKSPGSISTDEIHAQKHACTMGSDEVGVLRARLAELLAPAREDDLAIAEHRIRIAHAELDLASHRVTLGTLWSPCNGRIQSVSAAAGQLAGPELPPLITLIPDSPLRIRAFVEELDALNVICGMKVEITGDGLEGPITGDVESVAPALTPKRQLRNHPGERIDVMVREVLIRIPTPDQAKLAPGLPVDVQFGI